ncbi:hypothetical protein GC163_06515 [bacterium]|nr:hypothetical protein [bacterium]
MFRKSTWKLTTLALLVGALPSLSFAADASYQHIDHKARFDYEARTVLHQTHHQQHARPILTNVVNPVRMNLTRR